MISSRTLLLFLVALNLLALAWWSGAMEPLLGSVREPGRLESQIEPGSLVIVDVVAAATVTPAGARTEIESPVNNPPARSVNNGTAAWTINAAPAVVESRSQHATPDDVAGMALPDVGIEVQAAPEAETGRVAAVNPSGGITAENAAAGGMIPAANDVTPQADGAPQLFDVALPAGQPTASDVTVDKTTIVENGKPVSAGWQKKSDPVAGLPLISAALSGNSEGDSSAPATDVVACQRFQGLSYIAAREVEQDLVPHGVRTAMNRIDKGDFLVYIEPLATLQLAKRKQNQLRRLGVQDLHVIRAGYYRHGISLGMLRNHALANQHKTQMSSLGVTTMRIGPVNVFSARYDLTVRASPATMDSIVSRHEVLAAMKRIPCQP